jgi:hypothetical protein
LTPVPVLNIKKDLFYSTTRNHQGSLGRAVVAYFGKELGGHCFKEISDHFHRDPVVMSQGIKRLEKKIRDDETITMADPSTEASLPTMMSVQWSSAPSSRAEAGVWVPPAAQSSRHKHIPKKTNRMDAFMAPPLIRTLARHASILICVQDPSL